MTAIRNLLKATPRPAGVAREGVTIIEVLVVITLIAALAAITLPAVMRAREASRRVTCKNHLRNVGFAVLQDAEAKRRLPASGHFGKNANDQWAPWHNWVVTVLPWMEQSNLYDAWDFDVPARDAHNLALARRVVPVLTCPSDMTLSNKIDGGDLSYVVNGGFGWTKELNGVEDCPVAANDRLIDLNGNGLACSPDDARDARATDKRLFVQTGVFFLENWRVPDGTVRHHTLNTISDGLSNTIFLAENMRVGYDPFEPESTWASSLPKRCSFFVSHDVCRNQVCGPGGVDYTKANSGSTGINAGLTQPEGEAPWPSAWHEGGVHVVLGDGRVHFLAENVNGGVYAALLSPQGGDVEGPLKQPLVSDNSY